MLRSRRLNTHEVLPATHPRRARCLCRCTSTACGFCFHLSRTDLLPVSQPVLRTGVRPSLSRGASPQAAPRRAYARGYISNIYMVRRRAFSGKDFSTPQSTECICIEISIENSYSGEYGTGHRLSAPSASYPASAPWPDGRTPRGVDAYEASAPTHLGIVEVGTHLQLPMLAAWKHLPTVCVQDFQPISARI